MNPLEIDLTANYKTTLKRLGRNDRMRKARIGRAETYGPKRGPLVVLVPLPFGLGLFGLINLDKNILDSYTVLRAWEWSQFDYADHYPDNSPRWNSKVLQEQPQPTTRLAIALEAWIQSKKPKSFYTWRAN